MKIRLSGMIPESLSNGEGLRRVYFSQGCSHNCNGCFNQDTHPFIGGQEFEIEALINDLRKYPFVKGVTFSGGDPFQQPEAFAQLGKRCKEIGLNIWCYTGYTYEQLLENTNPSVQELLSYVDTLVEGRFEEGLKGNFQYKGSSNQRIIKLK